MTILFYPLKIDSNKVVYYASFTEDLIPIIEAMKQKTNYKVILIYHPRIETEIKRIDVFQKHPHSNKNALRELYHLMTSKFIIVDTYYLILGGLKKKKGQFLIQTWHASGALKKFGLEDQALKNMNSSEIEQFKKVYRSFDYILVASDKMGEIFKRSFGVKDQQLLKFGLPRMDTYFNHEVIESRRRKMRGELQVKENETMVLYVPTYRENEQTISELPIDFSELNEEFCPFVKLHPVIQTTFSSPILSDKNTDDLLVASDIVITDYSSLAIEASLLNKPLYFYTYDQDKYNDEKGLIDNYDAAINFQNYNTNQELMNALNTEKPIPPEKMNEIWNTYNDGNAALYLIEWMKNI
jgi:teichoic acid glycerol-phosphate primase